MTQDANVSQPPANSQETKRCEYKPTPLWEKIFATIGVTAAVVYAGIAYCQWQTQLETYKTGERAWLNVTTRAMDLDTIKAGIPINGRALLSNTGKTAAKKILSEFQIELLANSQAPGLRYDKSSIKHLIGYMPPTAPSDATSTNVFRGDKIPTETLSENEARDLVEGRSYLCNLRTRPILGHLR